MRYKWGVIVFMLIISEGNVYAQKHLLSYTDLDQWGTITGGKLTDDGKFAMYRFQNGPYSSGIIRSLSDSFKVEIAGYAPEEDKTEFSRDGHWGVFRRVDNKLSIFDCSTRNLINIDSVSRYELNQSKGKCNLVYLKTNNLVVRELSSHKNENIQGVSDFYFKEDDSVAIYISVLVGKQQVFRYNFLTRTSTTLYLAEGMISNLSSLNHGRRVTFTESINNRNRIIFIDDLKVTKIDDNAAGISPEYSIDPASAKMGISGKKIFFYLKRNAIPTHDTTSFPGVSVWSYKDKYTQDLQLSEGLGKPVESFLAVFNIAANKVICLQAEDDMIDPQIHEQEDEWLINRPYFTFYGDAYWTQRDELYVINTSTGRRDTIKHANTPVARIDPSGRYVFWLSSKDLKSDRGDYYFYNLRTKAVRNVTADIPVPKTVRNKVQPDQPSFIFGNIAGWYKQENAVLVSDNMDLWKVYLDGGKEPLNVTKGMGRKCSLSFKYLPVEHKIDKYSGWLFPDQRLLLVGQRQDTKRQGLYFLEGGKAPVLQHSTEGAYTYQLLTRSPNGNYFHPEFDHATVDPPVKAKNASVYLVNRASIASPPNVFLTRDFKSLTPLSNYQPQEHVNWMQSELLSWRTAMGNQRGILFKPENFDAHKKYPVIFYSYERCSDALNAFQFPKWSKGSMNIPWFVSNGYLVFVPDIVFTIGEVGKSSAETIIGAAKYLSGKPYIDAKHLGIQGHSFGGYQTNFAITQTDIFAAACSASGMTDFTSIYGSSDWQKWITEVDQSRMGASPWDRPGRYVRNSPVYFADQVTTPLLMIGSQADWKIPFLSQTVSYYSALRRLNKRVWILEYDDQGHILSGHAAKDYTIRMTQFFDHYLKGKPAPVWMTRGVPAYLKGINSGLEYDSSNVHP